MRFGKKKPIKEFAVPMTVRVLSADEMPFVFGIEIASVVDGKVTLRHDKQEVILTEGCTLSISGNIDRRELRDTLNTESTDAAVKAILTRLYKEQK